MEKNGELVLFGGEGSWNQSEWTASDDRVRGGKSQSYLDIADSSARFHGSLDIKTLGGAGFASQRTTNKDSTWDLSDYDGIQLDISKSDGKRYTLILKNELLPRNPETGREQATISYEYDFSIPNHEALSENFFIFIPWKDFLPTYRGKEKKGAKNLDEKNVKRFSIMMRSYFGNQEGNFSLTIKSIKAVSKPRDLERGIEGGRDEPGQEDDHQKSKIFHTPTLISLLAFSLFTYSVCTYICPRIKYTQAWKHWMG